MVSLSWRRRGVLQGLASLAVAAPGVAKAQPSALTFLAVGDWGRRGGRRQADVAAAMSASAVQVGGRFVVSAGDNFYPGGVRSIADRQWRASFEEVYAAASLQVPWYAALGNHDYRGDPDAQVAYSAVSPRWRMPARYFTVTPAPSLEIFVLDTTPIVGGYGEAVARVPHGRVLLPDPRPQLEWLKAALARSQADWKIVVGHHPIHSGGHHGGAAVLVAEIEPLLAPYGVQAYINGHDHALQHIRVGRTDHICTGAGASSGSTAHVAGALFQRSEPGFALISLGADLMRLEFRNYAGRTIYSGTIPRERAPA